MGLYERILGTEQPRVRVHQLRGCIAEFKRGHMTALQARTGLDLLDAAGTADVTALIARVGNGVGEMNAQEVEDVLFLLERAIAPYDNVAAVKTRFGV